MPFFTIAQGNDLDLPYFQQLADGTAGPSAPGAAAVATSQALYVSLGRLLRSQYVVTFDASAASIEDGSDVAITVTVGELERDGERHVPAGRGFLPVIDIRGSRRAKTILSRARSRVTVSSGSPHVAWYVDDVNVMELEAPPYVFTFDPKAFDGGDTPLRVVRRRLVPSAIESGISFSSVAPASSGRQRRSAATRSSAGRWCSAPARSSS